MCLKEILYQSGLFSLDIIQSSSTKSVILFKKTIAGMWHAKCVNSLSVVTSKEWVPHFICKFNVLQKDMTICIFY